MPPSACPPLEPLPHAHYAALRKEVASRSRGQKPPTFSPPLPLPLPPSGVYPPPETPAHKNLVKWSVSAVQAPDFSLPPPPASLHLTPLGPSVKQSEHAQRMTRRRNSQEGPKPGGTIHHSPFTFFLVDSLARLCGANDPQGETVGRTQHGGRAQHNPPRNSAKVAS